MARVQQALPGRGHGRDQPPLGEGEVPGHMLREHGRVLHDPRPRHNVQDPHTRTGLPLRELQRPHGAGVQHRPGAGAAVRHLLERPQEGPVRRGDQHPQGPGPHARPAGLGRRILQGKGPSPPHAAGTGCQPSVPVHLQQLTEHRSKDVRQEARAAFRQGQGPRGSPAQVRPGAVPLGNGLRHARGHHRDAHLRTVPRAGW